MPEAEEANRIEITGRTRRRFSSARLILSSELGAFEGWRTGCCLVLRQEGGAAAKAGEGGLGLEMEAEPGDGLLVVGRWMRVRWPGEAACRPGSVRLGKMGAAWISPEVVRPGGGAPDPGCCRAGRRTPAWFALAPASREGALWIWEGVRQIGDGVLAAAFRGGDGD